MRLRLRTTGDIIRFKSYYVVWKLVFLHTREFSCSQFKSYYVVWKPFFFKKKDNQKKGLNRTMQYGNSLQRQGQAQHSHAFKSYYVVWKLLCGHILGFRHSGLNRTMQYGNYVTTEKEKIDVVSLNRTMQYGNSKGFYQTEAQKAFKSYYVVWKPFKGTPNARYQPCLNRTMQYGNRSSFALCNCLTPSLNRTMQYGNSIFRSPPRFYIFCLNRTMQYGNDYSNV